MKRHPVDLFSLVAGLLFATIGTLYMLDQQNIVHMNWRWIPAAVFLTVGTAGIVSSLRTRE